MLGVNAKGQITKRLV